MRKFGIATALIFILFFYIFVFQSYGQTSSKPNFKVNLRVSSDESIKAQVTSYISRELRSLNDVTLVDDDSEWQLIIVAMQIHSKSGEPLGVTLSVVILENLPASLLKIQMNMFYEMKAKKTSKNGYEEIASGLYYYRNLWLRTGTKENLKSICEEIVAEFDNEYLEPTRELYRKYLK